MLQVETSVATDDHACSPKLVSLTAAERVSWMRGTSPLRGNVPHAERTKRHWSKPMTDSSTPELRKPNLVGINHVALEVGSIDEALDFYGTIFSFRLRGRGQSSAFIDMGDQFIALMETATPAGDKERHFGLVVDDRSAVRQLAEAAGAKVMPGRFLDFLDPWGNRVQVVDYADIQFTKAPEVLKGMGLDLRKSDKALKELAGKGMAV